MAEPPDEPVEGGDSKGPRLLIRHQREEPDGAIVTEERELLGCTEEEILTHIASPWDGPAEDHQKTVHELADAIEERLRSMRFLLLQRTEGSRVSYTLSLAPEQDGGDRPSDAPVTELDGHVTVAVAAPGATEVSPKAETRAQRASIDVRNQGLMVLSRGNLYANVLVQLNLELNLGEPDRDAG